MCVKRLVGISMQHFSGASSQRETRWLARQSRSDLRFSQAMMSMEPRSSVPVRRQRKMPTSLYAAAAATCTTIHFTSQESCPCAMQTRFSVTSILLHCNPDLSTTSSVPALTMLLWNLKRFMPGNYLSKPIAAL